MAMVWKIVVTTKRIGGEQNFPPQKEYFLVSAPDQAAALRALSTKRPDLDGGEFEVRGRADQSFTDWLGGMEEDQILSIMVVQ